MKTLKIIKRILLLFLVPSLLLIMSFAISVILLDFLPPQLHVSVKDAWMLVFMHAFTLIYILLYIKFEFDKPYVLPVSFLLIPVLYILFGVITDSLWVYMIGIMGGIFYALPLAAISVIIQLVIKKIRWHRS